MNRTILWGVLLLAAVPTALEAQAAAGLRVGARSAGLETSQEVSTSRGLVVGGWLGFGLSTRLALQAEVVYGSRGAEGLGVGTDDLDPGANPVDVQMQYLELPLLLRAGFPAGWVMPSFFAGPYAAFVLSCEVTTDDGGTTGCDDGVTQRFSPRSTDFGMVVGAALDLAMGGSTLFIDARYTLGVLSIEAGSDAFDARHTGFEISGGVAVPLGR